MHAQRSLSAFAVTVAILTLPLSAALRSQSAFDQGYDKAKQVTVTGMLIGSAAPKPPYSVYLLISTQDAKGNVKQWAVEGDSIDALRRRGHKDDSLRMGEVITVTGHPAKAGKKPEERMPKPIRGALARAFDLAKEGRLILGTEITLADGTKVPFGRMK
jgi:Family of unknown function (DUF6152)